MATISRVLTYDEWLRLPEVRDEREEVVKGEIRRMPPAKWNHARIIEELSSQFKSRLDRKTVTVVTSQFGLVIRRNPITCRIPDLAIFLTADIVEQDGYIHSAPALIVEVISPANTSSEREEKRQDYESIGLPELWVLSPESRTIEVLQFSEGRLRTTGIRNGGQIAPKLFPQASLTMETIWP